MNKAFCKYLTDAEVQLVEETKPASLAELDEDALGELHNRVRRGHLPAFGATSGTCC